MSLAIVLAAGCGSRSGSEMPKSLRYLAGKLWILWQLEALEEAGIGSALLVTGYRAEAFPSLPLVDRRVHVDQWQSSGPMASLHRALCDIDDQPLLIAYADCLWHPDWIRALEACTSDIALCVDRAWEKLWSIRFSDPLEDAESMAIAGAGRHQRLLAIGERRVRRSDIEAQFMGLWRVSKTGCTMLRNRLNSIPSPELRRLDSTALLRSWLPVTPITAVVGEGSWIEFDQASDLALYERRLGDERFLHDPRRAPRWPD
jgi:choline kinase